MTVRTLVDQGDLGLRVLTGHDALDQALGFVAISELPDPTAWLEGAELLLTSGMWLVGAEDPDRAAEEWVGRVAAAGARGVAFGLAPFFEEVPAALVEAARRHGLVLLEVPAPTPFVGIDRRVAELRAEETRRQEAEVGRSQLRLVAAARGGRSSVVSFLARELGGWVAVLDAAHEVREQAGEPLAPDVLRALAEDASNDARHSVLTDVDGQPVYAVPLGPVENREGTLCVDGRAIGSNPAQRAGLVGAAAVILAVLPGRVDESVHQVLVELLLEGDGAGAARVAQAAGVVLPDRVVAVALSGPRRAEAAAQAVSLGAWHVPGKVSGVALVAGDPALLGRRVEGLTARTGSRAGVSATHPPRDLARAVQEARSTLTLTSASRPLVDHLGGTAARLAGVLTAAGTRRLADDLLSPLGEGAERDVLLTSAAAWLRAHGRWDPAAASLGIHRETLRGRMRRLADLLGLDLDSFQDRLALSLALEADGQDGPGELSPGVDGSP